MLQPVRSYGSPTERTADAHEHSPRPAMICEENRIQAGSLREDATGKPGEVPPDAQQSRGLPCLDDKLHSGAPFRPESGMEA